MEVYFPSRRRHAGGVAGRHEWFQITTAPLDERLHSNVQEVAAANLAERASIRD